MVAAPAGAGRLRMEPVDASKVVLLTASLGSIMPEGASTFKAHFLSISRRPRVSKLRLGWYNSSGLLKIDGSEQGGN